jgi:SH3-like domain-containing protein
MVNMVLRERGNQTVCIGLPGLCAMAVLLLAVPVHAETAVAESMRPKPRPTLVSAPAPVDPSALMTPPAQTTPQPAAAALPLGPPAPKAAPARTVAPRDPNKGAVTNLRLPRFVSLKSGEGNARRGPGLSHRIDWVFTRTGMPLKITAEHGHWRRVEDPEGLGGWVHYALLSGVRSVIVATDTADFFARPDTSAQVAFRVERGVVARVIACKDGWCRLSVDGQRGWAPTSSLWGVTALEIIE